MKKSKRLEFDKPQKFDRSSKRDTKCQDVEAFLETTFTRKSKYGMMLFERKSPKR